MFSAHEPTKEAGLDPADLDAVELLAAYRARTLSPVEATSAVLARIARNSAANAWRSRRGVSAARYDRLG